MLGGGIGCVLIALAAPTSVCLWPEVWATQLWHTIENPICISLWKSDGGESKQASEQASKQLLFLNLVQTPTINLHFPATSWRMGIRKVCAGGIYYWLGHETGSCEWTRAFSPQKSICCFRERRECLWPWCRTDLTVRLFLTLRPWLGGSEPGCATGSWYGLLSGEDWWAGSRRWHVEMPSGHG